MTSAVNIVRQPDGEPGDQNLRLRPDRREPDPQAARQPVRTLRLPARYFCDSTPEGIPCREENFVRRELDFELPVTETALVLVDLWSCHHIDSWMERAQQALKNFILPVIDASRQIGLMIVHAPSPAVAARYKVYPDQPPPPPPAAWPPPEFRERRGIFARFRGPREQPPGAKSRWKQLAPQLDIHPLVRIDPSERVVATGQQLHDLCAARGVMHLLYAGFATNWCVLNRDYGMVSMRQRGYDTLLLRDATEGVEFPDTLEKRWATELAIREVEQRHGFSIANTDFLTACRSLLPP